MKKNTRYIEPEQEADILSQKAQSAAESERPKGIKRLKKAVNKT
jgi:hypothetical protein